MDRPSHRGRLRVRLAASIGMALLLATTAGGSTGASATTTSAQPIGLSRLLASAGTARSVRGIATFEAIPTATQVSALRGLGLKVQPMRRVPLALVQGPITAIKAAVSTRVARDVYPDERIQLFDTTSSNAIGGATARAKGFTGKGVTVAVVDSGCDATHPDLADHVAHNVKLYGPEYLNGRPDSSTTLVVPVELAPYNNSDLGSGHGTHVAGIIAADSTTDKVNKSRLGVAPDATLVCYSIGEVLFTTAVVTAYDHMLDQPGLWGIDVVNNSWGNSFRQFDPHDPVNVVTRTVAAHGVTVVFAAGNSGLSNTEMSLNPFSQAPWLISVAADSVSRVRGDFSSNGLKFDNATAVPVGPGGHTVFTGDRIGIYHPDVTAPGDKIQSTCATTGTVIGPCPPPNYGNTEASGTSMAAPHIAGAAAVLKQANPRLTPNQILMALQATATPVKTDDGKAIAPFWQVGYGHVNLGPAIDMVRAPDWATRLANGQNAAYARALASDGFRTTRSDFWTYDAPRLAVAGSDHRTFKVNVPAGTTSLKVALSHPSLAVACCNGMEWTVTVKDASGKVIGKTTEAEILGAGTASVQIPLSGVRFGTFTFDVSGELAVSDPDTLDSESLLGRMITLQVIQLVKN